jgi:hypothetical protein
VPCPALLLFAHVNSLNLDEAFGPLQFIDVAALAEAVEDQWHNQTLVRVNDCVVRLGVMQGEFHWHHHEEEDEFFYVVEGRFLIDLEAEDRTVDLAPKQGFTSKKWTPPTPFVVVGMMLKAPMGTRWKAHW